MTTIVFETHSWSEDNERGIATGWNPGRLSSQGRESAAQLGARRRDDGIDVVLVSDLRRAVETAEIALDGTEVPILHDWRLRECDYGDWNGGPVERVRSHGEDVYARYPGGESWVEAIERVGGALADVERRWAGKRVLIIGHMADYWALQHRYNGLALDEIGGEFTWQEGWEFEVD